MKLFSKRQLLQYNSPSIDDYKNRVPHPERIEGGLRTCGIFQRESAMDRPLVSIITVAFNAESTIEQTIRSVLRQTYDNVEYIIVDGNSSDRTLDIIRTYDDQIDYWMSEPDEGISDAFNKGIAQSIGTIIGIINADDWLSENQIELGVKALHESPADFVFGNLLFHDCNGEVKYKMYGDPGYTNIISSKMPDLRHPTVLVKRVAYERIGLFDADFCFAMDYEWLLRLHKQGGKGKYVKNLTGHMRASGVSDISYVQALKEVRKIAIRYGQSKIKANLLYLFRVAKSTTRRSLEKRMPNKFYHKLRKIVNKIVHLG